MVRALVRPDAYFGRAAPERHAARRALGIAVVVSAFVAVVAHALAPGAWILAVPTFLAVLVVANVLHALVWLAHGDGPGNLSFEIAAWAMVPAVADLLFSFAGLAAGLGPTDPARAIDAGRPVFASGPLLLATSLLATAWIVLVVHAGVRRAHGVEDYRAMFVACVVGGAYALFVLA